MKKPKRAVMGWREWLALPELGIPAIKAKIDTGAKSSAIHAVNVETFESNGITFVRFGIPMHQHKTTEIVEAEAPLVDWREVKSSNGQKSLRPTVRTVVQFQDNCWPIELTLVDRKRMRFRMLLGRSALRRRFVVDSGRSFIGGRKDHS